MADQNYVFKNTNGVSWGLVHTITADDIAQVEAVPEVLKYTVIAPYTIFILYLVFIIIGEANYCGVHKQKMDDLIVKQKIDLNQKALSGKHEEPEGEESEGKKE